MFETRVMEEQTFIATKNDTRLSIMKDDQSMIWVDNSDKRPIKSCSQVPVAPTTTVTLEYQKPRKLCIPTHLRDLTSQKMPYLYFRIINYSGKK